MNHRFDGRSITVSNYQYRISHQLETTLREKRFPSRFATVSTRSIDQAASPRRYDDPPFEERKLKSQMKLSHVRTRYSTHLLFTHPSPIRVPSQKQQVTIVIVLVHPALF